MSGACITGLTDELAIPFLTLRKHISCCAHALHDSHAALRFMQSPSLRRGPGVAHSCRSRRRCCRSTARRCSSGARAWSRSSETQNPAPSERSSPCMHQTSLCIVEMHAPSLLCDTCSLVKDTAPTKLSLISAHASDHSLHPPVHVAPPLHDTMHTQLYHCCMVWMHLLPLSYGTCRRQLCERCWMHLPPLLCDTCRRQLFQCCISGRGELQGLNLSHVSGECL